MFRSAQTGKARPAPATRSSAELLAAASNAMPSAQALAPSRLSESGPTRPCEPGGASRHAGESAGAIFSGLAEPGS